MTKVGEKFTVMLIEYLLFSNIVFPHVSSSPLISKDLKGTELLPLSNEQMGTFGNCCYRIDMSLQNFFPRLCRERNVLHAPTFDSLSSSAKRVLDKYLQPLTQEIALEELQAFFSKKSFFPESEAPKFMTHLLQFVVELNQPETSTVSPFSVLPIVPCLSSSQQGYSCSDCMGGWVVDLRQVRDKKIVSSLIPLLEPLGIRIINFPTPAELKLSLDLHLRNVEVDLISVLLSRSELLCKFDDSFISKLRDRLLIFWSDMCRLPQMRPKKQALLSLPIFDLADGSTRVSIDESIHRLPPLSYGNDFPRFEAAGLMETLLVLEDVTEDLLKPHSIESLLEAAQKVKIEDAKYLRLLEPVLTEVCKGMESSSFILTDDGSYQPFSKLVAPSDFLPHGSGFFPHPAIVNSMEMKKIIMPTITAQLVENCISHLACIRSAKISNQFSQQLQRSLCTFSPEIQETLTSVSWIPDDKGELRLASQLATGLRKVVRPERLGKRYFPLHDDFSLDLGTYVCL